MDSLDNIITSLYEFGTGVFAKTVASPLETVKLLQQLRMAPSPEGYSRIPNMDGIALLGWVSTHCSSGALWRGNLANILKAVPTALMEPMRPLIFRRDQPLVEETISPLETITGVSWPTNLWWRDRIANIVQCTILGGAALLIIHPLELARTRLAMDILPPHRFAGIIDCLYQIASNEGFLALYRGYTVSLIGIALYRTFYVIIYDMLADYISTLRVPEGKALCIAIVTTLSALLTYPLDTVRRYQMMDSGYIPGSGRRPAFSSSLDCVGQIINKYGFTALYEGCFFNTLHTSLTSILLLACDAIRRRCC